MSHFDCEAHPPSMIVCSCNIVTRRDIEVVIEEILVEDLYAVLTPNLIYHRLGRRGKCCGCFPHVSRILVEHATILRERAGVDGALDPAEREEDATPAAA